MSVGGQDISLEEHQMREVSFSPTEVALLRRELKDAVDVWPTDEPGRYILKAGSHVGFVALPGGRTLIIRPKVLIDTLFALLAAVYDPARDVFRQERQGYTTVESLFEFVVRIFAAQVEDLIARGILRSYRPVVDDPVALRGRLLFAETLRRRPVLRDRHWCTYNCFTPDVAENRILRWTAFCVQPYPYRERSLPGRLRRIGLALAQVSLDPEARRLFDQLSFHRLNDPYRPALMLARLLLDNLTFSGTAGNEPFLAFLVDMNWLFERYVEVVLQRAARQWGVQVVGQKWHPLDAERSVWVRPDVTMQRRGVPLLVLDAKYKLTEAQGDIYQMLAYCHALGLEEGVLVYPAHETAPNSVIRVRGPGNVRVRCLPLDLRGGPTELERRGWELALAIRPLVDLGPAVDKPPV